MMENAPRRARLGNIKLLGRKSIVGVSCTRYLGMKISPRSVEVTVYTNLSNRELKVSPSKQYLMEKAC